MPSTCPARRSFLSCAAAAGAWPGLVLAADDYPSRPIRLIVSSSPGSSPDVIARLIAGEMTQLLRQQVLVENRAGASSIVGINAVAKSNPDGYSIGYVTPTIVLNRALQMPLPFDAERDLQPVVRLGQQPLMLAVSAASPIKTLQQLINEARSDANKLSYASTGAGSIFHLAAELLGQSTGMGAVHVPYTSGPQAITDLIGGRVDFMFNAVNVLVPQVQAGRLRGLGVSSANRSTALPEVPTIQEQGVENFEVMTWGGLVAPAEVGSEIVAILNATVNACLAAPQVRRVLVESGYEIVGGTAQSFKAFLQSELGKWRDVVKRAGLQLR
jgi:tripartite-type tricarboxylate transporter receptor subunit TctC